MIEKNKVFFNLEREISVGDKSAVSRELKGCKVKRDEIGLWGANTKEQSLQVGGPAQDLSQVG